MATASVSASVLEFMGWLTDYMLKASWSTLTAWAPTTPKVTWTWTLIPTHHHVPNAPNTPDQVRDLCAEFPVSEFCISDLIWLNDVFRFKHSCSGCCSEVKPGSSWSSLRHWSQPAGSSLSEVWFNSDIRVSLTASFLSSSHWLNITTVWGIKPASSWCQHADLRLQRKRTQSYTAIGPFEMTVLSLVLSSALCNSE